LLNYFRFVDETKVGQEGAPKQGKKGELKDVDGEMTKVKSEM